MVLVFGINWGWREKMWLEENEWRIRESINDTERGKITNGRSRFQDLGRQVNRKLFVVINKKNHVV